MAEQVSVFWKALWLGMILGCLYDFFRITRLAFLLSSLFVLMEDLLFFLLSSLILFNFLLQSNQGQIRYFILVGVVFGWAAYYFTLGRLVMGLAARCIHLIKKLLKLLFSPLLWVRRQIANRGLVLKQKISNLKNKIKLNLKLRILMMYNTKRNRQVGEKGAMDEKCSGQRENQKKVL